MKLGLDALLDAKLRRQASGGLESVLANRIFGGGQRNKNLFSNSEGATVTNIGVTVTWDAENQEFIFNGTTSAAGDLKLVNPLELDWIIGDEYTISVRQVGGTATLADGTGGTTYGWGIFQDNAAKFVRGSTGLTSFASIYSFTAKAFELDANRSYIFYFQCWRPGTVFENYRVRVQIEHGTEVTDWVQHRA